MEMVLPRYSWALTLVAVLFGASLAARTVNTVAAAAIAPKPSLLQQAASVPQAATAQRVELDADKVARLFDVPLPKPQTAAEASQPQRTGWNPVPVRSPLHGTLVGTPRAAPPRYSLCQLTNPDVNETQVYAIGDRYQGARIYGIEKERVLLDHDGVNEYIDNSAAAAPNLGVMPMPQAPGQPASADVKQLSENQYTIAKSTINAALGDMSTLATQA